MRARVTDAAAVALGKAVVSSLVWASGFRALSDDDFARVVIAQRFAESPGLDPSGTSWLPLPFWLNGAAMVAFGTSVEVARAVALALGVASALLVWVALGWLGASRLGAFLGALAAAIFPYSAWLGVATVPELPTAALCLLGAASLGRGGRERLWGALALFAACLSRYEAWPIALVFALTSVRDGRARWPAAGVALSGLGAWLVHGAISHGSALFFVKRVSEYRRAVGAGNQSITDGLLGYPSMLVRCEPELCAFALVALGAALAVGRPAVLRRHAHVLLALGALMAFLVAGDLRDGAPTHHGERALLTAWLGLAALGGDALGEAWAHARGPGRAALIALPGLAMAPMLAVVRPWYAARDAFIDRSAEVDLGRVARARAGPGERLLVDSKDFGFYATMAGFGAPSRSAPLDDRDPRRPRKPDAFADAEALAARLAAEPAAWLVVETEHLALAVRHGTVEAARPGLTLLRLQR